MTSYQYESVDQPEGTSVTMGSPTSASNNWQLDGPRRSLAIKAAVFLAACVLGASIFHQKNQSAGVTNADSMMLNVPMEGMAEVRACTFHECYSTACDKKTAPYTCVRNNGGPHGGWYVTLSSLLEYMLL
jgi:hypothetical protein